MLQAWRLCISERTLALLNFTARGNGSNMHLAASGATALLCPDTISEYWVSLGIP